MKLCIKRISNFIRSNFISCKTSSEEYPDELAAGDEKYNKSDLIKVANEYGKFYLLQDYQRDDGMFDISIIKSTNGNVEYYIENSGKVWEVNNGINLVSTKK